MEPPSLGDASPPPGAPDGASATRGATPRHEYTVISNIHAGGLPPLEAGAVIVDKVLQILEYRAAGNHLESLV